MDIEKLIGELRERDALHKKDEINREVVDRIEPEYYSGDLSRLSREIRDALLSGDVDKIYRHQGEAIESSMRGNNVVLESPTASGKTLAFTVPMMESIAKGGTALMVYPMKAVARDQLRQVAPLCEKLGIKSEVYDGNTPCEVKQRIRDNHPETPILLTNPEYLNLSFLQWSALHEEFLERLSFIVFDEAHEYRGYFGSQMSLLIRRFLITVENMKASPKIFMATATCESPQQHATALTGREFKLISARNAMRPRRHFAFVNHDIPNFKFFDYLRSRIVNAAIACLKQGLSALIFCPSIKFLGRAQQDAVKKAMAEKMDHQKIDAYYAGQTVRKRGSVQDGMQNGSIQIVFCTNALELGIDVGGLDGVILAGFPDNVAAARQRIGRAGRAWNKDAFVLYYPMNNPMDKFFAANLRAFLDNSLNPIAVDPQNEEAIEKHVPCLLHELNYNLDDSLKSKLGDKFFTVAKEKNKNRPARRFNPTYPPIRTFGNSYKLFAGDEDIGSISETRKFWEAYLGAALVHNGETYRVKSHNVGNTVVVVPENGDVRTDAVFQTTVDIGNTHIFSGEQYKDGTVELEMFFRSLNIGERLHGYKLIDNKTENVLEQSSEGDARYLNNRYAFEATIPDLEEASEIAVRTLEQLIRVGAIFAVPADRHDTSSYSKEKTLYLYENYPGGIGVARLVFSNWVNVLKKGMQIAESCKNKKCVTGCPDCIMPPRKVDSIDKKSGLKLAAAILAMVEKPGTEKLVFKDNFWVEPDNG